MIKGGGLVKELKKQGGGGELMGEGEEDLLKVRTKGSKESGSRRREEEDR